MQLNNAIALVTGGSSGLGRATVDLLLAQGANVASLDLQPSTADDLKLTPAQRDHFLPLAADVRDTQAISQALDQIAATWKQAPQICVNCAGIAHGKRVVGKQGPMPLEEFQRVIDINLIGTFNVMRLVAAKMSQQQPLGPDQERGVIINTASIAAFDGQIGQTAYSASKGAIHALTLPAARELAQFGIRVMCIAPGIMHTPMVAGMTPEVQQSLAAQIPFPSRLGHAAEYAALVLHIIQNSYLNGSVIRLDGAVRMQAK